MLNNEINSRIILEKIIITKTDRHKNQTALHKCNATIEDGILIIINITYFKKFKFFIKQRFFKHPKPNSPYQSLNFVKFKCYIP